MFGWHMPARAAQVRVCRLGSRRRIVSVWDDSRAVLAAKARLGFRFVDYDAVLRRGRGPQRLAVAEGSASGAKWHYNKDAQGDEPGGFGTSKCDQLHSFSVAG